MLLTFIASTTAHSTVLSNGTTSNCVAKANNILSSSNSERRGSNTVVSLEASVGKLVDISNQYLLMAKCSLCGPVHHVHGLGCPGLGPARGKIKTEEMEGHVDPSRRMEADVQRGLARNERDFFYDPNLHGLNLEAIKKNGTKPTSNPRAHRADLNYLFTEMLNQLTVGHMYISGGDQPRPNFVPGGLLGADYKIENGRYRFAKIYNGENWNPNLRAPLTQPGVNVKAGEYLLAVNGRNLTATDNIYSFFEATANKQVVIKVGPNPDGSNAREVTVVPVGNELGLRNLAWIEGNRRKVDAMSGGKLAYIYLPNTAEAATPASTATSSRRPTRTARGR